MTRSLELYLHIPFCVKKCAYCDFLSGPSDAAGIERYLDALICEIRNTSPELKKRPVSTVFIGGGTPSLLSVQQMKPVLTALGEEFCIDEQTEYTIEANPGTITKEKLVLYREQGINRISIGLQSTFPEELTLLGRIHTYEDFLESFALAREAGFTNINVDLISAVPGQDLAHWSENLKRVISLNPEHISAYSLIIEEGTPFYEMELELPDEDTEYEMYEETGRILSASQYEQYEISNYARKGYACRHNIGYWRRVDYLGLGLGAASFLDGSRFSNTRDMDRYLVLAGTDKIREQEEVLTESDAMAEFMYLGLRMMEGVSVDDFKTQFGISMEEKYGKILQKYQKSGHLIQEEKRWKFSRKGIHVSNWILADFLE